VEQLQTIYSRYLENKASDEEIIYLLDCFKDPAYQRVVEKMVEHHLNHGVRQSQLTETEVNRAIQEIQHALHQQIENETGIVQIERRKSKWIFHLAGLLLVGMVSTAIFYRNSLTKALYPVQMQYLSTRSGERKKIKLPDGTIIWLSPSSALECPDQFNSDFREVRLEGEAFFEVAKDKRHPFIIHSGGINTKVVGTSFMVNAYREQYQSTVTVVTGIVQVSAVKTSGYQAQAITLVPNHRGVFIQKTGSLQSAKYPDAAQMLKRKDGILNYDGVPVSEVAADLARYYNQRIQIENSGKNCLCYGEFDTNKPLHITLEQLAAAINASIIHYQDKYIIKGGCEE
jgi:transmembrane sensor